MMFLFVPFALFFLGSSSRVVDINLGHPQAHLPFSFRVKLLPANQTELLYSESNVYRNPVCTDECLNNYVWACQRLLIHAVVINKLMCLFLFFSFYQGFYSNKE